MRLTYQVMHLATGIVSECECECTSAASLLEHVNQWNIDGKGAFIYTVKDVLPNGLVAHQFKTYKVTSGAKRAPEQVLAEGGYWTPVNKSTAICIPDFNDRRNVT